ncbi:acyl-CoA oxidase [Lizonia empirigonia]|nr:acyl-CoA oxidase [Lizonia empirigonia]
MLLMEKARASGRFDTFELTCLLWGGRAAFARVEKFIDTHDTNVLPRCYSDTSREGIYEQGLRMGKAIFGDMQEYDHDIFVWVTPRYNLMNAREDICSPFGHQGVLFELAIERNGTEEQRARWLLLARSGRILGTYCQTELGHGSFVRGIETTATFDQSTDEFIVHSPTVSSAKFWPAGLAFSTTHAVVMAQLIVGEENLGPHLFLVQIRSLDDGRPQPGIKMGDIGMKMGYNEADNGYATFDHVRIPRTDILMGHSQLSKDGTYTADQNRAKLSYSVMLLDRSKMPSIFSVQLGQAVTIATRYSVVREQGLGPENSFTAEASVMQYKSQHFRVLTLIAKSYAMFFAGQDCDVQYTDLRARQERRDHSTLPAVHALCAGLKAYVTGEAAEGAEEARKLCGGHGFMLISGLPDIVGATAGGTTFEGENYVMWQQVGRYLFKQVSLLQDGKDCEQQVSYLLSRDYVTPCSATDRQFLEANVQLAIYRHRAQRLIFKAHWHVRSSKQPKTEAWNEHMMLTISASRAHIEYLILQSFTTLLSSPPTPLSKTLHNTLSRLASLFALSNIINPRSTDALSLCSALGMRDGNVYENIMRWAGQMPINNSNLDGRWKKWVDTILKSDGKDRARL